MITLTHELFKNYTNNGYPTRGQLNVLGDDFSKGWRLRVVNKEYPDETIELFKKLKGVKGTKNQAKVVSESGVSPLPQRQLSLNLKISDLGTPTPKGNPKRRIVSRIGDIEWGVY